jgi:enoyl-CoA hydratase
MGAQTLQRLAGENDARAHRAAAVREYGRSVREHGLKETLRRRDEPFGDGYARVDEAEGRSDAIRAARER